MQSLGSVAVTGVDVCLLSTDGNSNAKATTEQCTLLPDRMDGAYRD